MKKHNAIPCNPSTNASFYDVLEVVRSRRVFLQSGMGAAMASFFGARLMLPPETPAAGDGVPLFSMGDCGITRTDGHVIGT